VSLSSSGEAPGRAVRSCVTRTARAAPVFVSAPKLGAAAPAPVRVTCDSSARRERYPPHDTHTRRARDRTAQHESVFFHSQFYMLRPHAAKQPTARKRERLKKAAQPPVRTTHNAAVRPSLPSRSSSPSGQQHLSVASEAAKPLVVCAPGRKHATGTVSTAAERRRRPPAVPDSCCSSHGSRSDGVDRLVVA